MRRWTAGIATLLTTVSTAAVPMATAWGTTPEPRLTADVNRDGLRDAADLAPLAIDAERNLSDDARGRSRSRRPAGRGSSRTDARSEH